MTLILPGTWEYEETISRLPFFWRQSAHQMGGDYGFAANLETRLLEPRTTKEMADYMLGGEYFELLDRCPWLRDDYFDPDDWEDDDLEAIRDGMDDDRDGCPIFIPMVC